MLPVPSVPADPAALRLNFDRQRAAYLADPVPSLSARSRWLEALGDLLRDHRDAIVAAIDQDFGGRSRFETLFAEHFVLLDSLTYTRRRLRGWMRPTRRHVDWLVFPGAANRVVPQPLGAVGVIVPWNFPLLLSFAPLLSIYAAGNRASVKMSELSPRLAALLAGLSERYLDADTLQIVPDTGGVGPAFAALPFAVVNGGNNSNNWFGTVRGRLGLAYSRSLFYVTGGFAYSGNQNNQSITYFNGGGAGAFPCGVGCTFSTTTNDSNIGWTAGGGVEYAFTDNISAKIEYLHVELGRRNAVFTSPSAPGLTLSSRNPSRFDVVRAGLNFRFGAFSQAAPVVARY